MAGLACQRTLRLAVGLGAAFAFFALARPSAASGATGYFASNGTEFDLGGAYAFSGKGIGSDEPAIIVAVSNAAFNAELIDGFRDRRAVIDHFFKDDETSVVYFEFSPDGKYRGLSYYIGPGNGCGYCGGGDVNSTVALQNGRLVGRLTTSGDRTSRIELDVAVASDDLGPALPDGGGEPGKAYLAYHEALRRMDPSALKRLLTPERLAAWQEAEKKGQGKTYVASLGQGHPSTLRITGGFANGDHAVLLVAGEADAGRVLGEVRLSRQGGRWRVDAEAIHPDLE